MKVLMISRSNLFSSPGGDSIQILMTKKYLEKLGVTVEVKLTHEEVDYSAFDLFHFFNIIRPADILPHIKNINKPFLVSTIYVDYSEYEKKSRKGLLKIINRYLNGNQMEYLKTIFRSLKTRNQINPLFLMLGQRNSIRHIANHSAMLLPNSNNEYKRFKTNYNINKKYIKVPNAIDLASFHNNVEENQDYKNHILCVGRIEGRKNQLNLILALLNTDLKLTIIGKASPNHYAYYNECKRLAGQSNNIQIIDHVDHVQLPGIYKAAKVHVLPSWFETTGLSSLEAGAMGCNIVITKKGDTEEYFSDRAYYCDPDDVTSIRDAIIKAFNEPVNKKLEQNIINNYTWGKAASQTLKAYKAVLSNNKSEEITNTKNLSVKSQ